MLNNDPAKKYLIIGILIFLSAVFIRSSISSLGRNKRLTLLKEEVSDLAQEKKELEENISYKQTEEYIEDRARNDLNLIKPDEKVYIVINENEEKKSTDVLSGSSKRAINDLSNDPNWYLWYRLFFDN